FLLLAAGAAALSGCVSTVVGATAGVAGATVGVAAKGVGMTATKGAGKAARAAIPGGAEAD
ncbi:MAG: hypothetical protein PHG43_11605, partial [Phenylobacterium sp.]|nr:hypothetical protein [Phenylobacterium sp.]